MTLTTLSESRSFGGVQRICSHLSSATGTTMRLSVYLPPAAERGPVPAVVFLSGLTCTEENFTTKAGAQRVASELGLIVVAPDTSPRGDGVADDPAYDLGQGAGFYLDATRAPWAPHFRMRTYVADELPALLAAELPVRPGALGIFGHSMGGHGALVLALHHPDRFRSVSAFAPICNPTAVPWGHKAFANYLGDDREAWNEHDAALLVGAGRRFPGHVLVDQGEADNFLASQLRPEALEAACAAAGQQLKLRRQPGYDHSYYFIASFLADHLVHHAKILGA
ncbi:MAG: S-formylglutathione hydrolase [Myxococcales bacterium]|nr:S-formylglutathione hydrolase [Myxococcales bacterium]